MLLYFRERVPARLLFAITAAQRGVPLPVGWEVLLLLFVLEVLREAGARTPGAMGQTMSAFRQPRSGCGSPCSGRRPQAVCTAWGWCSRSRSSCCAA